MKKFIFIVMTMIIASTSTQSFALTLDEAINIAMKKSPLISLQKYKIEESKEEKKRAVRTNFGKINLLGSYTYYNIPRTLAPIVPPVTPDIITSKDIYSLGLKYDVILFDGFSNVNNIKIAELGHQLSKIKYSLTKEQLIFNIKSLYYKILSLKQQLKAAIKYRDALNNLYKTVQKEVEVGKKAKIDLLKVISELENSKFVIESIENNIDSLKAALASMIGIEKVDSVYEPTSKESTTVNLKINKTYQYLISEIELKKAEKQLKKSKSSYFPKVSLSAYYGNNYAKGEKEELWQIGVNLNWLVFDFGARKSQISKAKISKIKALTQMKKTELELKSLFIEANNLIKTAEKQIVSAEKQLDFLKKIKQAEKIKYEKGASSMYDLLLSYAKEQQALTTLIAAKYNLQIQKAYLKYIMAGAK